MTESTQQSLALHEYARVIRRRKWIILSMMVLLPLLAVVHAVRQTPTYEGSAQVLLSRQNLANGLSGVPDPNAGVQDATLIETQAGVARVLEIAQRVVRHLLGLRDMTPQQFLGDSSVSTSLNSDILTFAVRNSDPELAARAATAYAEEYAKYRHRGDTASLQGARREVTRRIESLAASGQGNGPLYSSLLKREQQLRTMEALQTSNANVIQSADGAPQVSPKPVRDAALGLLLGIVFGTGLAFLVEALDTRVRSAQEIGDRLQLPLLARIPAPPKDLRGGDSLVMQAEPSGVQAEVFRMLRTNLEFAMLDHDVRSILVTSAVEEEGKSTTAANLALAFARAGQHVVLVDLDLRKPRLDRFFDLRGKPGITQVMLGRVPLQAALAHVPILPATRGEGSGELPEPILPAASTNGGGGGGRLEVLPRGSIPPNPGELVASHALGEVLAPLRERADIVLIDSPPLLHVGDAMTLSAKVDAVVIVARLQMLRRGTVAETHRLLATVRAHKLGFVLTAAEAELGYGYGYGFGDRYIQRPYRHEEESVK